MRVVALAALFLTASLAAAEDKLSGAWTKQHNGFELKFAFLKDGMLKFSMVNGDEGCSLDAKYTVDKDGIVKCEVTNFEKKGNFPVEKEKGYRFSFKVAIKGKTAKVSDFEGKDLDDQGKSALEGDYEKAKD